MSDTFCKPQEANRYDAARSLPPETMALWMEALKSNLPSQKIRHVLDLGCGTGRFTLALAETFNCPVVGVEPSQAMLDVAVGRNANNIEWKLGAAENIPLENEQVALVFMSQVFHHLSEPRLALKEIWRVLSPSGYLAIRNATQESNAEIEWLDCFPEANEIERQRMYTRRELTDLVCSQSFRLASFQTVYQFFTASYPEYFEKIKQRGLSALIAISDAAFEEGLLRLGEWASRQPANTPVYEPIELFIFQRNLTIPSAAEPQPNRI